MTKEDIDKMPAVALRFTADWCGPCKQFAPTFEQVANTYTTPKIIIDVSQFPELAKDYKVLGIPAVVFLKAGVEVDRIHGNQPSDVVKKSFDKLEEKSDGKSTEQES